MDHIILIIDNNPFSLAHVLDHVKHWSDATEFAQIQEIERYIRMRIPYCLEINGDMSSCQELQEQLLFLPEGKRRKYWQNILQHYKNKIAEGCDMSEYLRISKMKNKNQIHKIEVYGRR